VNIIKKLESDNDKVLSLMKRRLALDDEKIQFIVEGRSLTIELPEEAFMIEGLQVIKRGIASDMFKHVGLTNVKFIENYKMADPESNKELDIEHDAKHKVSAVEMSRSELSE
jgi:peptidylprolyl isomerase